jgi:hypothetical protein
VPTPDRHAKEATMIAVPNLLSRIVQIAAVAAILTVPQIALTQCAGISEEGRWRNLDDKGEPSYIDVKMLGGCGDEVLNGVETGSSPHYTMRVWVKQSTGKFYGRPTVKAVYRPWKGKQWLQGNVVTGGYQDQMWVRVEERDGQRQMHVVIRHQSLDSKPSSQSEYWFVKK